MAYKICVEVLLDDADKDLLIATYEYMKRFNENCLEDMMALQDVKQSMSRLIALRHGFNTSTLKGFREEGTEWRLA